MIQENKDSNKPLDATQYNTLFIRSEQGKHKNEHISNLIDILTNNNNKDIRHDALATLRNSNGIELLLEAIGKTKDKEKKQKLIAACWESGINCSNYLSIFVGLAINEDYSGCLDCMTVIEDMTGPFNKTNLDDSKKKLLKWMGVADVKNEKRPLLQNILNIVSGFE